MRPAARAGCLALLGAALLARPAAAEVKRFALLVGANKGRPHEAPLRYAETDVHAVAETLQRLGGYPSERIVRLVAPTADRVRSALLDLNLTIQAETRGGHEAVLFVYYSGHADARALHLGPTDLDTQDLKKLVQLSPAKLKVLLVDACRSGAITRVKGGRQVPPFQIGVDDKLRNEGYAVITSSSAGEDAQESDALRSSIFTHHFLTGLRGAADVDRNRQVTLGEAYLYAYEQALKTSMTTVAGTQHATFDYDMSGRTDPVLADLRTAGDHGQLVLGPTGEYLILAADTSALLVEATVRSARTALLLPPARYQVRLRTRTSVYQVDVALATGETKLVGDDLLRPIAMAQVVRKGETEATLAQGPTVAGALHGPLAAGFSPMVGAQIGWAFELPRITLLPRLGFGVGRSLRQVEGVARHDLREFSGEVAALYVFDFERLSLAPLVSVGAALIDARIERGPGCMDECRISSSPLALVTSVGGWATLPFGRGFTLDATLELANFYLRRQEDTRAIQPDSPRFGTLTYRAAVGVGYRY